MSVTTHCECCEHNRRLVERYRKPIPDGGRTWQERAAVLKVKYVDADEQLRGAVKERDDALAEAERWKDQAQHLRRALAACQSRNPTRGQ